MGSNLILPGCTLCGGEVKTPSPCARLGFCATCLSGEQIEEIITEAWLVAGRLIRRANENYEGQCQGYLLYNGEFEHIGESWQALGLKCNNATRLRDLEYVYVFRAVYEYYLNNQIRNLPTDILQANANYQAFIRADSQRFEWLSLKEQVKELSQLWQANRRLISEKVKNHEKPL